MKAQVASVRGHCLWANNNTTDYSIDGNFPTGKHPECNVWWVQIKQQWIIQEDIHSQTYVACVLWSRLCNKANRHLHQANTQHVWYDSSAIGESRSARISEDDTHSQRTEAVKVGRLKVTCVSAASRALGKREERVCMGSDCARSGQA